MLFICTFAQNDKCMKNICLKRKINDVENMSKNKHEYEKEPIAIERYNHWNKISINGINLAWAQLSR